MNTSNQLRRFSDLKEIDPFSLKPEQADLLMNNGVYSKFSMMLNIQSKGMQFPIALPYGSFVEGIHLQTAQKITVLITFVNKREIEQSHDLFFATAEERDKVFDDIFSQEYERAKELLDEFRSAFASQVSQGVEFGEDLTSIETFDIAGYVHEAFDKLEKIVPEEFNKSPFYNKIKERLLAYLGTL